jgi:hypothetical protein
LGSRSIDSSEGTPFEPGHDAATAPPAAVASIPSWSRASTVSGKAWALANGTSPLGFRTLVTFPSTTVTSVGPLIPHSQATSIRHV